ncbi:MAG: VOC family protein [Actinomycetota bacterium]|nr:VOC family protein [Actinomycetota bacterium]
MGNAVVHFEVMSDGDDPSVLVDFYTELFGWTARPVSDDGAYFDIETDTTTGIAGGIGASPEGPTVTFYVAVDDVSATVRKAEELGGKAVTEPTEDAETVTIADVADPEGNVVSLVERGPLPDRVEAGGEHPVVFFEILAFDWKAARDFWTALFGWDADDFDGYEYSVIDPIEPGIGGGIGKASKAGNLVTFYVQTPDIQDTLDRAEDLGGRTVKPIFGDPDLQEFAHFADPSGNVIGLLTPPAPAE